MGRTKIASFQRKSYKNLQLNARKIPNLSNKIIDFGIVQAELFRCLIRRFNSAILSQEWREALWDKFVRPEQSLHAGSGAT
jgi:hypothetical protein